MPSQTIKKSVQSVYDRIDLLLAFVSSAGKSLTVVDPEGKGSWRGGIFYEGKSLLRWAVINLAGLSQDVLSNFVDALYNDGRRRGLSIDFPVGYFHEDEANLELAFENATMALNKKFGENLFCLPLRYKFGTT